MEADNETVYMGKRHEWGGDLPFGLDPHERRQHLYVIGQTGTGKSTLLRNLILQDIEAGRGVGLIDPHGDLAHGRVSRANGLGRCEPQRRSRRKG
jgi:DNA helicase HerA-like ATPase